MLLLESPLLMKPICIVIHSVSTAAITSLTSRSDTVAPPGCAAAASSSSTVSTLREATQKQRWVRVAHTRSVWSETSLGCTGIGGVLVNCPFEPSGGLCCGGT